MGISKEQTRAMIEAIKEGSSERVMQLLAAEPGLIKARDEAGVSAILLAIYYGHESLAQNLADAGVELDIFEASALGKMTRVVQLLNQQPDLVNAYSPDGFTPLGLASYFGHQTAAKALLGRGANVNLPSKNDVKARPLNSAVANRHVAVAELLLAAGADVNGREQGGYTPLHEASANGQVEMVRLLLAHGADITCASNDGKTAVDMAYEKGERPIVAILSRANLI